MGSLPIPQDDLEKDLRYHSGADSAAAFTDSEAQLFFHGDWGNQFNVELQVVARHHHFGAFRKLNGAGYVRGAEVELGAVVVEERRVTAA